MTTVQVPTTGDPVQSSWGEDVADAINGIYDEGTMPYVLPIGQHVLINQANTMPMNPDDACIVPFHLSAPMRVISVSVHVTNTATARSLEVGIYKDVGGTSLSLVTGTVKSVAWTPTAAAMKTLTLDAIVDLSPGIYYLAIRNAHATNNVTLGTAASTTTLNTTKFVREDTTGNTTALGAALDISGWTSAGDHVIARLNGACFGESSGF